MSNGFTAGASATPTTLQFGLWAGSGDTPTTVSYEIGTSPFATDLGSGTVALNSSNTTLLFVNGYGYDVYSVTIPLTSLAMISGDSYWLSLSDASDATNSGTEAWDITNGGSGGPATCNFRQSGTNFGDCGLGGESWVLSSNASPTLLNPARWFCSAPVCSALPVPCAVAFASSILPGTGLRPLPLNLPAKTCHKLGCPTLDANRGSGERSLFAGVESGRVGYRAW